MKEEYDKIMEFFSMNTEERSVHLSEIFEESVHFFERFKYVLEGGDVQEIQKMIKQAAIMQARLKQETQKVCKDTGLSEEELKAYSENPANFTPDQWEHMQKAKGKIETESNEITKLVQFEPEGAESGDAKPKKKRKGSKKRKGWVQG